MAHSDLRRLELVSRRISDYLKPVVGSKSLRLQMLLAEARQFVALDIEHGSEIDGFPSSTPGSGSSGGGSGRTITVPDEAGQPDRVPITSTEAAGLARAEARARGGDELHQIRLDIERRLQTIANEIVHLDSDLTRARHLRRISAEVEANQRYCYVAKHLYRLPFDPCWEPHKQTTFAGKIDRPWPEPQWVCRWVYDFTREHHRLPTEDEMRKYLSKGRVLVRTGGQR